MASDRKLDPAGIAEAMKKRLIFLLILFAARHLSGFSIFTCSTRNFADFEYAAGVAQATNGNYEAALNILKFGWHRGDQPRFLSELAAINYKKGDRKEAKHYLNRLLTENPADPYANQFMGALFLLDANVEAALKYWNRIGEPEIERIEWQPLPPIDPGLMDKALVMAPASYLKLEDYLETDSRFQMMGTFRKYEFRLKPLDDKSSFNLIVRPELKNRMFSSKLKIASLVIQGIFTETIKPEFHNIARTTISSTSLISWDEYRNRFYTSLSLPFEGRPHARIKLFTEVRNETWSVLTDVNLLKWVAGVDFGETYNGRFKWTGGTKLSNRRYKNFNDYQQHLFQEGWLIHAFGTADFSLLRIPEERLTVQSKISAGAGLSPEASTGFVTLEHSLELRWFLRDSGDDLAMMARFGAAGMFGPAPFDEYFVLGADRDTDLLLRAHRSSIDKRGENPFGPGYMLLNLEISKYLLNSRKFRWRLAPFLDAGRIMGNEIWNGNRVFLDGGIQSGFQIFGSTEMIFTYGKDLITRRNVFYVTARL